MSQQAPIPNSYQIDKSVVNSDAPRGAHLWGGEYPGNNDPALAQERIERFLDSGISHFINLTEADERLDHYDGLLQAAATNRNTAVSHQRIPIRDYSTPTPQYLIHILDAIDDSLAQGNSIYVHCWGGIGRTGTVIGCWLVRHGLSGEQALAQIAHWRKNTPAGGTESPETDDQRNLILNWTETK